MRSMLSVSHICLAGGLAAAAWLVTGQAAQASSYGVVYSFQGGPYHGSGPAAGLAYANGTFYGTTTQGGTVLRHKNFVDAGTVFSISADTEKLIYSFGEPHDGSGPHGGLIEVGGLLYGTTATGGSHQNGTVFQLDPAGGEKVLVRFHGNGAGGGPVSSLLYKNGKFYGTTAADGSGYGTVFSMTPSGRVRVLHTFTGGSDGATPMAGLTDIGGTLYGTTSAGGSTTCTGGCGTVFKLVPGGIQVVYSFKGGRDGAAPEAALVGVDDTIYGTTSAGGTGGCSGQSPLAGCGTVFKIAPDGTKTVVYNFSGGTDGYLGGSLTAVGRVLYGTTVAGGGGADCDPGCGTVFKIAEDGHETVLHAFQGPDGAYPAYGAKLLYESGSLYGTTKEGGSAYYGTVFSLTP